MTAPAMIDLVSGIVLSTSFLLQVLYFALHFKTRYKDSIFSGTLQCAKIIAIEPLLAVYAVLKSSGSHSHFAADDIAMALFASLAAFWTLYAFLRLSKNIEE